MTCHYDFHKSNFSLSELLWLLLWGYYFLVLHYLTDKFSILAMHKYGSFEHLKEKSTHLKFLGTWPLFENSHEICWRLLSEVIHLHLLVLGNMVGPRVERDDHLRRSKRWRKVSRFQYIFSEILNIIVQIRLDGSRIWLSKFTFYFQLWFFVDKFSVCI